MTPGEYLMHLDEPRERPRQQPDFPPDHSRREWVEFEREQLTRARTHSRHLELPALCILAQMKRADQFWRRILASKLDALFFFYEKELDYDRDDDHENNCRQLADARRAAGYDVHPAWRKYADHADASDDRSRHRNADEKGSETERG
jgi:hypothetical protein